MATLYTQKSNNVQKTWLLMAIFFVLIILIGWAFSYVYNSPGILYIAVIFSMIMNVGSYWFSDKIALAVSGAHPISHESHEEIFHIVENLCITAGLPLPKIYIISDPAPNAFATGRDANHSAIAVTSGLLARLEKSELEGVIAHELSHVKNRDTLLQTVVVVLVGMVAILSDMFIRGGRFFGGGDRDRGGQIGAVVAIAGIILAILSPIIATLIQLAISRKREFLADASAGLLTRYPEGLANALRKISDYGAPMQRASNATAHLFISNPFGAKASRGLAKLFMTHPPVEERIKALLGQGREL